MRILVLVIIGVVAGVAAGYLSAHKNYIGVESRLGPFSDRRQLSKAELAKYLAPEDAPKLTGTVEVVGSDTFDFGTMRRGADGSHVFKVRNVGEAPLGLEVSGSTCKCTVGSLDSSMLGPGEETDITLEWTARSQGTVFSQSATIRTTDPQNAEIKLTVSGVLVDAVIVDPGDWAMGDFSGSEPHELKTTIYIFEDKPLQILEAGWARDWMSDLSSHEFIDREVTEEDRERFEDTVAVKDLVINIDKGLKQGPIREMFRIQMGLGESPEAIDSEDIIYAELSMHGQVVGPVSMIGGPRLRTDNNLFRFEMGDVTAGEALSRKIFLSLRDELKEGVELTVESAEPAEVLDARLGEPSEWGSSTRYPLEISIKPSAPPMTRTGKSREDWGVVTIKDTAGAMAPVKVYIKFRVLDLADSSTR